ncbi:MAG: VCBS repeat-containing protein [Bdellovibrionales bacterium]|nr:VCBS repeat-containing protein [Bdellovibrionales bacterium]
MKILIIFVIQFFVLNLWAQNFEKIEVPFNGSADVIKIVDINGDGKKDLIVDDNRSKSIVILQQISANEFSEIQRIPFKDEDLFYFEFELGHYNEDDFLDIVVHNLHQNHYILYGSKSGVFSEPQLYKFLLPVEHLTQQFKVKSSKKNAQMAVASEIELGILDIEIHLPNSSMPIQKSLNLSEILIENDLFEIRQDVEDFVLGDYDGDGILDLVFVCATDDYLMVLKGDKDFNFVADKIVKVYGGASKLLVIDVNSDGKDEVFVGHYKSQQSLVLSYVKDELNIQQSLVTGSFPTSFYYDSKSKNFVSLSYYGGLFTQFNNWKSTYFTGTPVINLALGRTGRYFSGSDINEDGHTDFAAIIEINGEGKKIFVLYSQTP